MFRPLYRDTVLCAITRSFGIFARILMRLPVIPSLRYSCSGSPLALPKGKTARESRILETRWGRRPAVSPEVNALRLPLEDKRPVLGIRTGPVSFWPAL